MILVTEASGNVGAAVVGALLDRGRPFKAGYRTRPDKLPTGVNAVTLDFEKPETLPAAFRGVDTLFLLSSTVAPERNAVKAAQAAGVRRIVKLSVWAADQEPFVFAKWHRAIERAIEGSGLRWTFLRPGGYMQNVTNSMGATIKAQGALYSSAAAAPISHVDVRDVGAVAARVLSEEGHEGKAYELSGPAAITYHDVADTLTRVLGKAVRCIPISDDDYRKGAIAAGMPAGYVDALVDLNRYYRDGGMVRVSPAVRLLLGRDPVPFEQFARDHAAMLR